MSLNCLNVSRLSYTHALDAARWNESVREVQLGPAPYDGHDCLSVPNDCLSVPDDGHDYPIMLQIAG